MPVLVGTSGWQYRHWRDAFYPAGVPQRQWLEYYAGRFATVENNGTFDRLPARETFEQWRTRTPEGFVMAVKASRYLTHIRRLRDPAAAAAARYRAWRRGGVPPPSHLRFRRSGSGSAPSSPATRILRYCCGSAAAVSLRHPRGARSATYSASAQPDQPPEIACGAVSLRRHCPDQVQGVAVGR
jgi:hypothetical protein